MRVQFRAGALDLACHHLMTCSARGAGAKVRDLIEELSAAVEGLVAAAAILGAWLLGALARASWVCWALRREAKASIRLTELTTTRADHV